MPIPTFTLSPNYKSVLLNNYLLRAKYDQSKCNFSQRLATCDLNGNSQCKTFTLNGLYSFKFLMKWFQYVIEVYMRSILCTIGLGITSVLTLIVLRNKAHARNFSNCMYKQIHLNALFNIGYCSIHVLSLMNTCVYPKSSFCARAFGALNSRSTFPFMSYTFWAKPQEYNVATCKILQDPTTCQVSPRWLARIDSCNNSHFLAYVFVSVSRCALATTSNNNKLRKCIEHQDIKLFYAIVFLTAMGFRLTLSNKMNILLPDYFGHQYWRFE